MPPLVELSSKLSYSIQSAGFFISDTRFRITVEKADSAYPIILWLRLHLTSPFAIISAYRTLSIVDSL